MVYNIFATYGLRKAYLCKPRHMYSRKTIYDLAFTFKHVQHRGSRLKRMRPITASAASGGLAGVLISLAKEAWGPEPWIDPLCLAKENLFTHQFLGWDWDIKSLIVGIFIGLLLGPIIEFFHLLRQVLIIYLRRQIAWLSRAPCTPKSAWRVLE